MKLVHGIDWLSFSAYLSPSAKGIEDCGYFRVEKQPYGTRNFSEVFKVFTFWRDPANKVKSKMIPFCTLCAKPQSSILNERLVTFKLDNSLLYTEAWFTLLLMFLDDMKLQAPKISRIDLFRDFQEMRYNGNIVSPYKFLQDIAAFRLNKKGGAKFQLYADCKDGGIYAVTYGSILSGRQLQIYNKSKELREVQDKPYIRAMWEKAGFDMNCPTFRAEIRIQKRGLDLLDLETSERAQLNLQQVYEFHVQPVLDAYMKKVAVWTDVAGNTHEPFLTCNQDKVEFPFIPRFRAKVDNPNTRHGADQALRWAKTAKLDVESHSYISQWHSKTIAILKDFIWLLEETIPVNKEPKEQAWYDVEYHEWAQRHTMQIRSYVRNYTPEYICEDEFKHTDDLFTSYPDGA